MLKRKYMIIGFLTLCLTATLFISATTSPATTSLPEPYDPWCDINDDGVIDIEDIVNLAIRFGSKGTPINKTALLLELQSRVYSLNASIVSLMEKINALEANYPLEYVVGNNLLISADTEESSSGGYELIKEIKIYRSGTLRISFDLKCGVAGSATDFPAYGRIYRNGVAVGTEQIRKDVTWWTYTEDISGWSKGDAVQLDVKRDGGYYVEARNFRLYAENPLTEVVTDP